MNTLIIKIPVYSTDIHAFCKRQDDCATVLVTLQLYGYIYTHLPKLKINPKALMYALREIVNNSFDAYAGQGLTIGKYLEIKVVIQHKDNHLLIKIKDNASGFLHRNKGTFFKCPINHYQDKPKPRFHGGWRIGLEITENHLKTAGAELWFKNRKIAGAATYILFPEEGETTGSLPSISAKL